MGQCEKGGREKYIQSLHVSYNVCVLHTIVNRPMKL